jgi:hypothetical protein
MRRSAGPHLRKIVHPSRETHSRFRALHSKIASAKAARFCGGVAIAAEMPLDGAAARAIYKRLIMEATYPAPNPLSMLTTLTLDAHEFSIPSSAARPLNAAP